jgi:predicted short-subunit dehydrogenase-like oxidoreductase (DUF2520 family)
MKELSISVVGSGRVAAVLAPELYRAGFKINAIISRNLATATEIALRSGSTATNSMVISEDSRLVILAVSDDALGDVSSQLVLSGDPIIVHTSASNDLSVFPASIRRKGVVYPLQTFTHGRDITISDIHFFTEASDEATLKVIDSVVSTLSSHIHHFTAAERRALHLAAVFVSNFVNHMLSSGFKTADHWKINPEVFTPLITETVKKALEMGPALARTGPAARKDMRTIEKHIDLLSFSDDLKNLYKVVTYSIMQQIKETNDQE